MAQLADAPAADKAAVTVPVRLTVDPAQVRYRLDGIGGNYCFNLESPVTRHTLDHLPVAAGRTEMSLRLWAPQNLGGDPSHFDYQTFAAADQPGSRIRHELEIMRELSRWKIPYITSVWRLPLWMVTVASPAPAGDRPKVKITETQWPQVLQSIGTYLLYAKEQYQAEPDLFSFNEYYRSLPPVSVSRGRVELDLAGESLTSLTTLPITPPAPLEARR